jgi:DNA-binding winged helix-turn-helix (wHTH) protein
VRFGPFAVDVLSRQLTQHGEAVHLTPKAFDLLALLIAEAPRIVPKAELHERLWPGTFVTDATLVGVVKELRRALGDQDDSNRILRTVHRVGYGFCAPIVRGPRVSRRVSHWLVLDGRRIELQSGENIIGRDPSSVVHLEFSGVSRRHARITTDDGGAVLEDVGSKNGTALGEAQLDGTAALKDGDRIRIGSVTLVYRASDAGMSTETQVSTPDHRDPS